MASWFDGLSRSREMSIEPNPFKRSSNQIDLLVQCGSGFCQVQHQSRQHRPQGEDRVGQMVREMDRFVCIKRGTVEIGRSRCQISEPHLDQEILTQRLWQPSREIAYGQATLPKFETPLNTPAPVTKGGKFGLRITPPVKQGGGQDFHPSTKKSNPNQTQLENTRRKHIAIRRNLAHDSRRDVDLKDHFVCFRGISKLLNQPGEQLICWEATIQKEGIIRPNMPQYAGQLFMLPHLGRKEVAMDHQANGVVQAKCLSHWGRPSPTVVVRTDGLNHFRQHWQEQGGGISDQQLEAMPTRHHDSLLTLFQQQIVERTEHRRTKLFAGLGKSTFCDSAHETCLIGQPTKKVILFALKTFDKALRQSCDQRREGLCGRRVKSIALTQ